MITIGHQSRTEAEHATIPWFYLDKLDNETMTKVIRATVNTLPPELIHFVIRLSGGYVKMAIAIAEAVARAPANAAYLSGLPGVQNLLRDLIPNQITRSTMQALALLTHVGWDDEVAQEGKCLMSFAGVNWPDACHAVSLMQKQGLVAKKGRFRYVTPHILAIALAKEEWEARQSDIVNNLLLGEDHLPTPMAIHALLERVADMGDETFALPLVESLLDVDGLIPTIETLERPLIAELFGILSTISPKRGLAALERLLEYLPRDRLQQLVSGRQNVVWSLEKMLWLPETYEGAARLLLLLAEAENASNANNATGVWTGFFGTRLGGTAVPALDRHRLIDEALSSAEPSRRHLALKAIQRALSIWESRMSTAEYQGGRLIPPEWHPGNLQEDQQVRLSALSLLDKALDDPDIEITKIARGILLGVFRSLVQYGLFDALISRVEHLNYESDKERIEAWEMLGGVMQYEGEHLDDTQIQHLKQVREKLIGTSFHDRLHRIVGKFSYAYYEKDKPDAKSIQETLAAELAEEAYHSPDLLNEEISWLTSPDAQLVFFFAARLGELDVKHQWIDKIEAVVNGIAGATLLSAYLKGRVDAGDQEWVEDLLDQWAIKEERLAIGILESTWRSSSTDRGAYRLINLVDKGWLPANSLGQLIWGRWTSDLSEQAFTDLLRRASLDQTSAGSEVALGLLLRWHESHSSVGPSLAALAWSIIERPSTITGYSTMLRFYWDQLAPVYLPQDPIRAARAVLNAFEDEDVVMLPGDRRLEILWDALKARPDEIWQEIGQFLLRGDLAAYGLQMALRGGKVAYAGIDRLLAWAKQNEPHARYILADLAGSEVEPLTSLGHALLVMYPGDERIDATLTNTFLSGSWSGSEIPWLQSKLERAKKLQNNSRPAVKKWADKLVKRIESDLQSTTRREEEFDLRFYRE